MNTTDEYKSALKVLNKYIWENGYRHTPERETVLQIICSLKQPFVLSSVIESAKETNISTATIYNSLHLFEKAGIVSLIQKRSGSKSEWEVISGRSNRLQLICKHCGRVSDFKDMAISNAVHMRKYSNFTPEHFTIFVYGECKHCRKL